MTRADYTNRMLGAPMNCKLTIIHWLRTGYAWALSAVLLAATLVTVLPTETAAQDSRLHWTGTWAAAPVGDNLKNGFEKQTLRQIVHTSIGGTMARIQVSNVFGIEPLTIADVHIAQRETGSSIVAHTDRPVHFGGLTTVTIAAGAMIASDPIDFRVSPLADVAISIYIPNQTHSVTYHPSGFQTNYIADGDVSSDANLAQTKMMQSYYFLTGLEIQGEDVRGAVVTLGASITDGYRSLPDTNRRWPNDLAKGLLEAGIKVGVLNEGISGNRLLMAGAGQSAETRFDRDVLAEPGVRWVIFSDDPINDLGSTHPAPTGDQLIEAMKRLIARAHERQIKFYCSTLTPYQGAGYWTEEGEVAREQINAFIRSSASGCDGVIDQDGATHDPTHPAQYLPAYDSGDHLHPNTAGLQAIANAVDHALFLMPANHVENVDPQTSVQKKR
jgi:lysophospholipase L1-like esterase